MGPKATEEAAQPCARVPEAPSLAQRLAGTLNLVNVRSRFWLIYGVDVRV